MIKTEDIKIESDGTKNSFFVKEGYISQSANNTIDANRADNFWSFGRIINSAWSHASCYKYAKNYVLDGNEDVLDIGCGTLVKQHRFFFENGFSGKYFCIDQASSFRTAFQIGLNLQTISKTSSLPSST